MKKDNVSQLITDVISEEIRNRIINESMENGFEKFHVTMDGQLIDSCDTQEEANQVKSDCEKDPKNKGKMLLIDKKSYSNYDEFIEQLDGMSENLNEEISDSRYIWITRDVKLSNGDVGFYLVKFKPVDNGVELSEDELTEELMKFFNTDIKGYFTDSSYNKVNPPITGVPIESSEVKAYVGDEVGRPINNEINENKMNKKLNLKNKHKKQEVDENEDCVECGKTDNIDATEEEIDELFGISKKKEDQSKGNVDSKFKKFIDKWAAGVDTPEFKASIKDAEDFNRSLYVNEGDVCEKCGKDVCECSKNINESKKKKVLRLTEAQMNRFIANIIKESHPGITVTKKAQGESKKENEEYAGEVEKKMKDYLSFDGNDNPEFPKAIGKGEKKVAEPLSKEDQEYVDDYRGGKALDLTYDQEPTEEFKKRLRGSLTGSPETGNEQEEDSNIIKSDVGKEMLSNAERKVKKVKKDPMYKKDPQPVTNVHEMTQKDDEVITEEIEKIKKLYNYQDRTQ